MQQNNTFTRRWFIGGMAAGLGSLRIARAFAAPGAAAKSGARLRIGVLSDVHICNPCAESKPFAYAEHAKKRVAPEFADGAVVRAAKVKDKKKGEMIEVSFPAARTQSKCRVFEYEVTATLLEDDVDLVQAQRRVMAPDFHLPETQGGKPGSCVFAAADLPMKGRYRFDVRPVECFGHKGRAIHAEIRV